ncbi:hypothetical protein ACM6T0_004490 [Enterobacter kobei]
MMNVVINDKDLFFRFGLLKLLQQIFSLAETDFIVSDKLDATTVHDVDVIVMNFSVGETVICHQVPKKKEENKFIDRHLSGEKKSSVRKTTVVCQEQCFYCS